MILFKMVKSFIINRYRNETSVSTLKVLNTIHVLNEHIIKTCLLNHHLKNMTEIIKLPDVVKEEGLRKGCFRTVSVST